MLEITLEAFGLVHIRAWGDVVSIELFQDGKTVFSFQIAALLIRLASSSKPNRKPTATRAGAATA